MVVDFVGLCLFIGFFPTYDEHHLNKTPDFQPEESADWKAQVKAFLLLGVSQ